MLIYNANQHRQAKRNLHQCHDNYKPWNNCCFTALLGSGSPVYSKPSKLWYYFFFQKKVLLRFLQDLSWHAWQTIGALVPIKRGCCPVFGAMVTFFCSIYFLIFCQWLNLFVHLFFTKTCQRDRLFLSDSVSDTSWVKCIWHLSASEMKPWFSLSFIHSRCLVLEDKHAACRQDTTLVENGACYRASTAITACHICPSRPSP